MEELGAIAIIFLAIMSFVYLGVAGGMKLQAPAIVLATEQLRQDASNINLHEAESEGVMAMVAKTNMELRKHRFYNKTWWACIVTPNELAEIPLIPIPERK